MSPHPLPSLRTPGEARSAALGVCSIGAVKGADLAEVRDVLVVLGLLPKPRRSGLRECGHDASDVRRDHARRGHYCLACQRERRAAKAATA